MGCPLILLGFYFLVTSGRDADRRWRVALLTGISLAGGVCMWLPYVWAVPAILAAPLLLFGAGRQGWPLALRATLVFALATGLAYALVMMNLGINSKADLQAWIGASSHGVETSGITRAVFGLPRSLMYIGNDGILPQAVPPERPLKSRIGCRVHPEQLIQVMFVLSSGGAGASHLAGFTEREAHFGSVNA